MKQNTYQNFANICGVIFWDKMWFVRIFPAIHKPEQYEELFQNFPLYHPPLGILVKFANYILTFLDVLENFQFFQKTSVY